MDLSLLGNRELQIAVRHNLVSFPAQAPVFGKKPRRDIQWRLAVLYFTAGWSTRAIAARYGFTRERCGQIISDWRIRATALGYIQTVAPDDFDFSTLLMMAKPVYAAESEAIRPSITDRISRSIACGSLLPSTQ